MNIFLRILPIVIFAVFPFYALLLKIWLGDQFNQEILNLTKIFSLSVLFSCGSHILITKFEASKILKQNIKFESYLLPFFLVSIFLLIINSFPLAFIASLILIKEFTLLILRMNFLKSEINHINKYYYYLIIFLIMLFFSMYNQIIFLFLEVIMIINILLKYDR